MLRSCDFCGEEYFAQRQASRFCSTNCRVKNNGRPAVGPDARHSFVPDDDDPVEILKQRRDAKRSGDDEALAYWMAKWEALPPSGRDPNPENW